MNFAKLLVMLAVVAIPAHAAVQAKPPSCTMASPAQTVVACTLSIGTGLKSHALGNALDGRAVAYADLGEHDKAVADCKRALDIDPHEAAFPYNCGIVYDKFGERDAAIGYYSRAIALAPDLLPARVNRALLLTALRRFKEARADLDRAIALKPNFPPIYAMRGFLSDELGDTTGALKDVDTAIRLSPKDHRPYVTRGYIRTNHDDYAGGISDFNTALSLDSTDALAYDERGEAYRHAGRIAEAFRDYDRAVTAAPNGADELARRCWNRIALNRELDRARADCDAAVRLKPDKAYSWLTRGYLFLRQGGNDEAIAEFGRALARDANNPDALFGRGIAEHREGHKRAGDADIAAATAQVPRLAHVYALDGFKP